MKITPVAGSGVPSAQSSTPTNTDRLLRAKAIASGQTLEDVPHGTGDPQADRIQQNIKKIKMRTQVSTNRPIEEQSLEVTAPNPLEVSAEAGATEELHSDPQVPTADANEPAPVVEATKPLSPQFAALAKAKRALQVKERELVEREKALQGQSSDFKAEDYISKADLAANPLKVFEAGISYDQLTEAILANQAGAMPEIQALKAEIKALKDDMTGQLTERDKLSEQQVLGQMRRDVDALTQSGEQFEAIRLAKAQQDVVDLIHRAWKETGDIMDMNEAAQLVEDQLIEEASPFAQLKKVQSRLKPEETTQPQLEQKPLVQKPGTKVMRTLTNRDNARPGAMDRRSRALAAWNGNNKRG